MFMSLAVLAVFSTAAAAVPSGFGCATPEQRALAPTFCNASLTPKDRVASLVANMTVAEKINMTWISGCTSEDPDDGGVKRLGIPGYTWGVEILHGAQSRCLNGSCPTIFPVLASTTSSFNTSMWHEVGSAISTEMRALNNLHVGRSNCPTSMIGTNGWGPNVNLARDPRWGRVLEVGSEDPYVSGVLGASMIRGLQEGEDSKYVKLLATIKHFTAYSMEGSDGQSRHGFDPNISLRDMAESYLPAFKAAIVDGKALGMMCSYTSINGTAMCESEEWIEKWARRKHGFKGNVVTDCGALNEGIPGSTVHNAAAGLNAGSDLNCGRPWAYKNLSEALEQSLVTESQLDATVARSLELRVSTGMFDSTDDQPYTRIGIDALGSKVHRDLAYDVAVRGMVLLQNPVLGDSKPVLPLPAAGPAAGSRGELKVAIVGPHANSTRALLGNYFDQACAPTAAKPGTPGTPSNFDCIQTPASAIAAASGTTPTVVTGCVDIHCTTLAPAVMAAVGAAVEAADVVVVMVGISQDIEGEGRDRTTTSLPGAQNQLLEAVLATAAANRAITPKRVVVVLVNGGTVSVDSLVGKHANSVAVVEAWYPGVEGSRAIAAALYGTTNAWGKLPVTVFAESFSSEVKMTDMSMTTGGSSGGGRTYKYWTGDKPLWEFAHGLSFTSFTLEKQEEKEEETATAAAACTSANDRVPVAVKLTNTGAREGEEVVFVFHKVLNVPLAPLPRPHKRLIAFQRLALGEGSSTTVSFSVPCSALGLVGEDGNTRLFPGKHLLDVGRGHGETVGVEVQVTGSKPLLVETLLLK